MDDPRILWEAIKGFIRNFSISFASFRQKIHRKKISDLESNLRSLEHANQHTFSDCTATKIETVRKKLNLLYRERAEFLIQRSRQNYYFQGSRPSHLLALRLRNSEKFANITAVKSQTGEVLTDQKSINDTFRSFYRDLYSSNSKCESASYTSFLSTLNLPHLAESDSESLARPLSLIELESLIKVMSKGKSPGLDGIPVEFYLTFWSDLGPLMLDMMQYSHKI